jgi:dihydroorotase
MILKYTANPARLLNLNKGTLSVGADGDVTMLDTDRDWVYKREDSASRSKNNPFFGWKLKGKAMATVVAGKLVYVERK